MWYDIDGYFGCVRVHGASRIDFVQRMSSGDVAQLQAGRGTTTVFTTPVGRIVDYTRVLGCEESLLLLVGGGNQDKLVRWLRKYVFFNDDVRFSDETAQTVQMAVFDDDLPDDVRALPLHGHLRRDGALWVRCTLGERAGAWVLFEGAAPAALREGAADAASFDAARVLAGAPRFPNELTEDYIPLEAGVWDAVSFRKGCYVGQEIIARMESRGQLARRLMRMQVVRGDVTAGAELLHDGQPCGSLTSVAGSHALGYVRRGAFEVGRALRSGDAELLIVAAAGVHAA